MSFLPPKLPNSRELITRKKALKRGFCTLFHQNEWKSYVIGIEPHATVAVCSKCGAEHLIEKGFITAEEVDRKIDKVLKKRLP